MKGLQALWIGAVALCALSPAAFADGNVAAVVSGSTLTLTGDAASNFVTITSGGATNAFTVTPYNGTTLNGSAAAATFPHVRSLVAVMGAGDDRVDLSYVNVAGNVRVHLDDGNDQLYFTGTTIGGRVIVRCGAGTDLVRTDANAVFRGFVSIRGDAGNDELQIVNAQFRGWLHVDGGADDDHVLLQSVVCAQFARVEVFGSRGVDFVEILFCTLGNDLFIDAGPGEDRVRIAFTSVALDVSVYGGTGEDDVLSLEAGNAFRRLQEYGGFEEGQPR